VQTCQQITDQQKAEANKAKVASPLPHRLSDQSLGSRERPAPDIISHHRKLANFHFINTKAFSAPIRKGGTTTMTGKERKKTADLPFSTSKKLFN
jgi:hypothetical protein